MTSILESRKSEKRIFNVKNDDDVQEFRFFLLNNKWKTVCPFLIRYPYENVVSQIKDEIVVEFINQKYKEENKYDFSELEKATVNW
jgi:hypothetical protein